MTILRDRVLGKLSDLEWLVGIYGPDATLESVIRDLRQMRKGPSEPQKRNTTANTETSEE